LAGLLLQSWAGVAHFSQDKYAHALQPYYQIRVHDWMPLLWHFSKSVQVHGGCIMQAKLSAWLMNTWNARLQDQALLAGKMA